MRVGRMIERRLERTGEKGVLKRAWAAIFMRLRGQGKGDNFSVKL
jgi:hypothetical protein